MYDNDAESIAYEALQKALESFNPNRSSSNINYILVVIKNALYDYVRKNKIRNKYIKLDEAFFTYRGASENLEDIIIAKEKQEYVKNVIKKVYRSLDNETKEVIKEWFKSDYISIRKLAAKMDRSPSFIQKQIKIFKDKVKQNYDISY